MAVIVALDAKPVGSNQVHATQFPVPPVHRCKDFRADNGVAVGVLTAVCSTGIIAPSGKASMFRSYVAGSFCMLDAT